MLSFVIKPALRHLRPPFSSYSTGGRFPGAKSVVDGVELHYEQVGRGKRAVLLLPGGLGSSRTDFSAQLDDGLDQDTFTLVAWDPPGYGYSRPPERTFPADYLERDARLAASLMSQLGHDRYSALGWSDGCITALHLAAQHPERVRHLVLWGGLAYMTPNDTRILKGFRDVDKLSKNVRSPLEAIYGPERLRSLLAEVCDARCNFGSTKSSALCGDEEGGPGDVCLGALSKVVCPTLVFHGDLDPIVDPVHHLHLVGALKAELVTFKEGNHNLHLRFAEEFNSRVASFLITH